MMKSTAAAVLTLCVIATPAAAAKSNPERDTLPPSANAGYFLGYPSATYSWHGCTKTATVHSPAAPVAGEPEPARGSKQKAATFTITRTAPYVSWQVKRGWKICGAQISAVLESPAVSAMLLAQVGYTSGPNSGSTSATGTETIPVTIPTKGIGARGFEEFEGQTFAIRSVQQITVFMKKR